MFIYLLWCHEEDGPECLKATLDRESLIAIAETYGEFVWFDSLRIDVLNTLKTLLLKSDEELSLNDGKHRLHKGWGGLHLQVVKAL